MKTTGRPSNLYRHLRDAILAFSGFDQVGRSQITRQTRDEVARMVLLATSAELIGLSLAPSSLTLCLLPHFVPTVYQWRRATREPADFSEGIQGGC